MGQTFNVFLDFSHVSTLVESMIDSEEIGNQILYVILRIPDVTKNAKIVYYYDSCEILEIISEIEQLDGPYFDGFGTKLQLALRQTAIDVSSGRRIDPQSCHAQWDSTTFQIKYDNALPMTVRTLAELEPDRQCIITFGPELLTHSSQLHLLVDAHHLSGYPVFKTIPYFTTLEEASAWLISETTPLFLLKDRNRFQPTTYLWEAGKQRVYQCLLDNSYWYLDYYHRDNRSHFEVFNSRGEHLGEADMSGHLDTSRRDKNKKAKFLK